MRGLFSPSYAHGGALIPWPAVGGGVGVGSSLATLRVFVTSRPACGVVASVAVARLGQMVDVLPLVV